MRVASSMHDTTASKPEPIHDSARGSPVPLDAFSTLVKDINSILGPCNGIDSAGVDVGELKGAMAAYTSNDEEWERYAFADYSRAYTRNLVDRGNGKSNLVRGGGLICRSGFIASLRSSMERQHHPDFAHNLCSHS